MGGSGAARCYTCLVPTTRPRHTITETPPVQEALDALREQLGDQPIDIPDLVIRGAKDKLVELLRDDPERAARLRRLADAIRNRTVTVGDPKLADEVKRLGLIEPDAPA
jgi:hypothetical protein